MLTSSDAKFRCLWYMVVWSILLMIVSQFFRLIDHIAFYVFSAAAMLLLPLVTSIYSTTGGRHGAGLLRVSYIFCDPVLACVTVIPILLLSRLPRHIDDFSCLLNVDTSNLTSSIAVHCSNLTSPHIIAELYRSPDKRLQLMDGIRHQIGIIQGYLLAPSLLTLAMGRRSRKMSFATIAAVACYWMFTSIETADLLNIDIVAMATARRSAVISTAAIVAIAMIIVNSYAVVTLCSYICPSDTADGPVVGSKRSSQFDKLYRILMGVAGVMFAEVPLLAARGQVISLDLRLPAVFYIWAVKDSVLIALALVTVVYHTLGARRGIISATCGRMAFDNPDVFFLPEKRDAYIVRHQYYPRRFSDGIDGVGGGGSRNRCESVLLAPDVVDPSTSVSSSSHGNGSPSKKSKRVTFHFDLHHHHHSRSHRTRDNVELDVVTSDNNSGGGGRNDCLSRGNVFKPPPPLATAAVPSNGIKTRSNDGDVANVNSALRKCDGDNDDIGNNMAAVAAAAAAAEVDVYCQQQTDLSIAFNEHEMDLMLKPENGLLEHRNITAAADASAVMNLSDCDSDDNVCETKVAIS